MNMMQYQLRDSQLGDERVNDVSNYIRKGKLWDVFESKQKVVLLIDEIDKADIEFPNDLQELDKMVFILRNWANHFCSATTSCDYYLK